ncbi:MAG TPA: hypothetical protein VF884_09735 [Nitrososphaeraceae archaeon]
MLLNLQSRVMLSDGVEIPRLGLGVYQTPVGETLRAVKYALKICVHGIVYTFDRCSDSKDINSRR